MSKKPVRVGTEAEEEIGAAILWHESERSGLGSELWDEFDRTVRLISEHPGIGDPVTGAAVSPAARRMRLRRFPYYVVYRERESEVQIVAFAHARRQPGYWRSRRP